MCFFNLTSMPASLSYHCQGDESGFRHLFVNIFSLCVFEPIQIGEMAVVTGYENRIGNFLVNIYFYRFFFSLQKT